MKRHTPVERKWVSIEDPAVPGRPDITIIEFQRVTEFEDEAPSWDSDGGFSFEDQDPERVTVDTEDQRDIPLKALSADDQKALLAVIEQYQTTHEPDLGEWEPEEPPEVDPYERELERRERRDREG